jgi:CRP-like cAMP-binding protein
MSKMMLVVQGKIEIQRKEGDKMELVETLQQGDIIGMYGVFCENQSSTFSVVAQTSVRILTLDREFFEQNISEMEGLREAVENAIARLDKKGIPKNDYRLFDQKRNKVNMTMSTLKNRFKTMVESELERKTPTQVRRKNTKNNKYKRALSVQEKGYYIKQSKQLFSQIIGKLSLAIKKEFVDWGKLSNKSS